MSDLASSSTPKTPGRKGGCKRFRAEIGSDSSLDGELSYLDLDTGRVLSAARYAAVERISLSSMEFEGVMAKLSALEKGLEKLNKLEKLDDIESSVKAINSKMCVFEQRLSNTETRVTDLQKSVEFVSAQYDGMSDIPVKVASVEKDLSAVKTENALLNEALVEMKKLNQDLKEDLLDTKARSMRENLIFTNIDVRTESRDGRTFEDTESVLCDFLQRELHITDIKFDRVHRIRSNPNYRSRDNTVRPPPIVAKFTFYKDKELVRKSAHLLRGKRFGINEQFPDEIEQRRRMLYPHLRHARRTGKRANLIKDRLYVGEQEIRVSPHGDVVDRQGRTVPTPTNQPATRQTNYATVAGGTHL